MVIENLKGAGMRTEPSRVVVMTAVGFDDHLIVAFRVVVVFENGQGIFGEGIVVFREGIVVCRESEGILLVWFCWGRTCDTSLLIFENCLSGFGRTL